MWIKNDDNSWSNPKLRRAGRSARGLFWDLASFAGKHSTDGWVEDVSLPQLETSLTDPDIKKLLRVGLLHKRGDQCRCLDKQGWTWPKGWRGVVIHDFLDYNPSREENTVKKAQTAELRDPALRARVRARDFGRCRYCGLATNVNDRRGDAGETLDHMDPLVAAGEANLVIACRGCNSAKKKRTPEQANMVVLEVTDVRALHYAALGITDPDLAHDSKRTQVGQAHGPGRVGSDRDGSGQVGSGRAALAQIGPPTTPRDSQSINPYQRAAHTDPAADPPPARNPQQRPGPRPDTAHGDSDPVEPAGLRAPNSSTSPTGTRRKRSRRGRSGRSTQP